MKRQVMPRSIQECHNGAVVTPEVQLPSSSDIIPDDIGQLLPFCNIPNADDVVINSDLRRKSTVVGAEPCFRKVNNLNNCEAVVSSSGHPYHKSTVKCPTECTR
jgi:hypothetical protein